jgi:hypothetical protein
MRLAHGLILLALLAPAATSAATLETLLTALAPAAGADPLKAVAGAKWSQIAKIPDIKWRDSAPRPRGRDYIRAGSVPINGLGTTSIVWEGLPDAALGADLLTATRLSPDKYDGMLKEQFSSNVKLRLVRGGCTVQVLANSAVYEAAIPGKQPLFLHVNTVPNWNNGNTTIQVSVHDESRWAC